MAEGTKIINARFFKCKRNLNCKIKYFYRNFWMSIKFP